MARLLTVESDEITFTLDMGNQASRQMIRLLNNTPTRVAFEVCSSIQDKYEAWPAYGVVSARSTCYVTVSLQNPVNKHYRVEHGDMIFIRSVVARPDTTTRNVSELFRELYARNAGEDIVVRVKHITESSNSWRARAHPLVNSSTLVQRSLNHLEALVGQGQNGDLLGKVIVIGLLVLVLWLLNIMPLIWSLTWFMTKIPIVIIMFVINILIVIFMFVIKIPIVIIMLVINILIAMFMFVIKIPIFIFMFVIKTPMILVANILMVIMTVAISTLRELVTDSIKDSIKDWIKGKIDRFVSS